MVQHASATPLNRAICSGRRNVSGVLCCVCNFMRVGFSTLTKKLYGPAIALAANLLNAQRRRNLGVGVLPPVLRSRATNFRQEAHFNAQF